MRKKVIFRNTDLELENPVRKGKFSEVFMVNIDKGDYVVKASRGKARENLQTEYKILHELFKQDAELLEEDGELYLLKKWKEGQSLQEIIESRKRKKEAFYRTLSMQLLEQLSLMHQAGFLHNDIKPDNIIVDKAGNASFIDFGNALKIGNIPEKFPYTFVYGPQEAILQFPDLMLPCSDLFALGMTLIHCLTQEIPVQMQNPTFGLHQQINYRFMGDKKLSENWNLLLAKATQQYLFELPPHRYSRQQQKGLIKEQQQHRFQSADVFRDAIEKAGRVFRKTFF